MPYRLWVRFNDKEAEFHFATEETARNKAEFFKSLRAPYVEFEYCIHADEDYIVGEVISGN